MCEELIIADALLITTIEVICSRNTKFVCAPDDGLHQLTFLDDIGRPQRTIATVRAAGTAAVVFGFDEVRKNAIPVPATIPELRPMIVVFALTAN